MKRSKFALFCVLALIIIPAISWAWQGKVVGVQDGDSITVLHDGKGEKIRLYRVDCPEEGQDFGNRAKQFTSSLVFERVVEVKPVTKDRYGRTVAMVYSGNKCGLSPYGIARPCQRHLKICSANHKLDSMPEYNAI
jgi:endonuclease YncB( thermonuclease family)